MSTSDKMPDHGGADAGVGELLPCPFCGKSAVMDQDETNFSWSVGCNASDEAACMGYQSFTTFARRSEAVRAWNTRAALSKPAPVAANASAEARLREALEKLKNEAVGMLALGEAAIRQTVGNTNIACLQQRIKEAEESLSTHSHASDWKEEESRCTCGAGHGSLEGHTGWCAWVDASDCDKQGPPIAGPIDFDPEVLRKDAMLDRPSDRTADVTVEELEAWLLERWRLITIAELARSILSAFTMGRR